MLIQCYLSWDLCFLEEPSSHLIVTGLYFDWERGEEGSAVLPPLLTLLSLGSLPRAPSLSSPIVSILSLRPFSLFAATEYTGATSLSVRSPFQDPQIIQTLEFAPFLCPDKLEVPF